MKRFYKDVAVIAGGSGWQVHLDGRGIKTAGGRPQCVPSAALAGALADEWAGQGPQIEARKFVLRDSADYAIDVVSADRGEAVRAILPFAESDTLCYRGEEAEALHARQVAVWEPLLTATETRFDVRFERVCGIIHRAQPAETLTRLAAVLHSHDPFTLAALHTLSSLAASLVIALAAIEPDADAEALWNAAELEQDWQAELWGKDAEAEARRAGRLSTFAAAMRFAALVRSGAD